MSSPLKYMPDMSTQFTTQNLPNPSNYSLPKVSSCSIQAQNGLKTSRQNTGQKNGIMQDIQVRFHNFFVLDNK